MITTYVNWGGAKVKITWKRDQLLPRRNLITSVHGFCFYDNKLLLVDLNHRGWDFPGGHIESEETPEECLKREAMEEGYVAGECHLLGHIVVDHNDNPNWDEESGYPKIGYQVFYRMDINQLHTFEAEYESMQRIFIDPSEIASHHHDWHDLYQEIVDSAIEFA